MPVLMLEVYLISLKTVSVFVSALQCEPGLNSDTFLIQKNQLNGLSIAVPCALERCHPARLMKLVRL